MHRRAFLAAAVGGAGVPLAGCAASGTGDYDVGMTVTEFTPERVEVAVGDTVVWENTSSRGHTVTAFEDGIPEQASYFASGGFDSEAAARDAWTASGGETGIFGPGERYEHRFEVPGRYDYVCLPHERRGMVGTVVVREDPTSDGE